MRVNRLFISYIDTTWKMGSQPTKTQIILFLFIFFLLKSLGAHAHKALKSITPNFGVTVA